MAHLGFGTFVFFGTFSFLGGLFVLFFVSLPQLRLVYLVDL